MPLKLSLKPGEKFVLNGAVLVNGDRRSSLVVQNNAAILRERDIMQAEDANTPARRIYFPVMMMYLEGETKDEYYNEFVLSMSEFMGAVQEPNALATCVQISKEVMAGQYYKALVACKHLFEFEQELLSYDSESVSDDTRENRQSA